MFPCEVVKLQERQTVDVDGMTDARVELTVVTSDRNGVFLPVSGLSEVDVFHLKTFLSSE